MPHIEAFDGLTTLAGARWRGAQHWRARAGRRNAPVDRLQSPAPGARGQATVLELIGWRSGVIVYRATGRRPWTVDDETMPWLALRRPKFDRLLGGIAFVGPYAIWLVCAPNRTLRAG
jgi:hypothetical protein